MNRSYEYSTFLLWVYSMFSVPFEVTKIFMANLQSVSLGVS